MSNNFKVQTEVFEGPLELLLSLIEKRKLLINDIALAQVTDDYIQYIEQHESELPLAQASHFIVIASTLLLIKSKSLLPTIELTQEETDSVEDLELRLKIFQRIKTAGEGLQARFGAQPSFTKKAVKRASGKVFAPPKGLSIEQLRESVRALTTTLPKPEKVPQAIVKKVISLEDMIGKLTSRVQAGLEMRFKEFAGVGREEKVNVIVSFLAMLELVKRGLIAVEQEADGDIRMQTKDVGTPSY